MNQKSIFVIALLVGLVSGVVYSQKPNQLQHLGNVTPSHFAFLESEIVAADKPDYSLPGPPPTIVPTTPLSALSLD